MTIDPIIPEATKLAAKRGFIRTTMQGYEALLAVGLTANAIVGAIRGEADLLVLGVTAAVAVVSPPLAGLRSYLSIAREGIPGDYEDLALVKHAVSTPTEQEADRNAAIGRVRRG